jgi:hypothetical protein
VTGRPELVDIAVSGVTFTQGQKRPNNTDFGAYAYFIAPGSYAFSFGGVGVQTRSVPGVTVNAGATTPLDVTVDPSASVTPGGNPQIGTTLPLALSAPGDGNLNYVAAASLATTPVIPIDWRAVPLAPDAFFVMSLSLPAVFQNFIGTLNASGNATASVAIPNQPALVGVTFHVAFVTLGGPFPSGIKSISGPRAVTIAS